MTEMEILDKAGADLAIEPTVAEEMSYCFVAERSTIQALGRRSPNSFAVSALNLVASSSPMLPSMQARRI